MKLEKLAIILVERPLLDIGTKDGPEQNDTPVLPQQFQYEPGFFLKVLAQNCTFENCNLNTMRNWFQKYQF